MSTCTETSGERIRRIEGHTHTYAHKHTNLEYIHTRISHVHSQDHVAERLERQWDNLIVQDVNVTFAGLQQVMECAPIVTH